MLRSRTFLRKKLLDLMVLLESSSNLHGMSSNKTSWQQLQHDHHLKTVNTAHIVLVPKKADATSLSDYMPISLTHSVAKLIYKVLATRLGSTLNSLISSCQSTFIRKRSIHDNFLYTQNTIRELHRAKHTALFFKLDITKAFDSIRWDFLLEVLQRLGFGSRWRA
jgi:hypothetical protein